jgi:glutamate-1-semialdehyde 2,1-aminomutase
MLRWQPSSATGTVLPVTLSEAVANAHRRFRAAHPLSAEIFDRASAVMPGGSTRSVLDMRPFPFRVATAHGARLVDVDGNEYLDVLGDYTAGLLGHDPGPVAAAVSDRLSRGWSLGATHVDEVRLAELVCDRFAGIEQVRFTNSGTEANLMAVQLARHHTGRDLIVVFDGAYHGGLLYFGAGGEALRAPFDFRMLAYNDVASLEQVFADVGDKIACVLVEPMMGAAGCIPAVPEFLASLRSHCDQHGALLVFDEVMTSRMSHGGAQGRLGVRPDLTTLGKYLAGGMTFGAFGGSSQIMAAFDPARGGELTHGGTFNNNVVSMAGGVAALSEVLTGDALDALFVRGESLRHRLCSAAERSPLPVTITGWGSMMSIHTVDGPVRSPADLHGSDPELKDLLFHEVLHRGVYMAPRGFVALSLAVTDGDVEQFVDVFEASLDAVASAI